MESRPFRRRSEVAIAVVPSGASLGGSSTSTSTTSRPSWWRGPLLGFLLGAAAATACALGREGAPPPPLELLLRSGLFAKALASASAAANPPPPAPCAASGMCSLPSARAWHGDLADSASFRAALSARAFKKELVLLCTDARSLDLAMQPVGQMARLGMAHQLLLADGPRTCERAREVVAGAPPTPWGPLSVGCGWYGGGEEDEGGEEREQQQRPPLMPRRVQGAFRLWALRMRTALRAVRLGHSVLVLDSDTVLFADPYPYLKHPALLGAYQWISQPESARGDEEGRGGFLNGGVYYVQGAAPSGPAAFMLYEATRRMLRWDDDRRATLRSYWRAGKGARQRAAAAAEGGDEAAAAAVAAPPSQPACCDADQDLLNDVFRTMRTGTLTSACALRCALDGAWKDQRAEEESDGGPAAAAAAAKAATSDDDNEEESPEATRARLRALIARIEKDEGCDEYWRIDALSEAPEWSWPVIYGPTSAGFPENEVAAAFEREEEDEEARGGVGSDGGTGNNRTTDGSSSSPPQTAEAVRRAHYARRAREDPARVRWGELRVMNARGFDPRLGGRFYPRARGALSRALDAQLVADCPRCPALWPDPEDPASAALADAAPRERLALMPPWLLTSWQAHGWRGYWAASPLAGAPGPRGGGGGGAGAGGGAGGGAAAGPSSSSAADRLVQSTVPLLPAPAQLLGHVWYVPEAAASLKVAKRALQMASGAYDWALARGAHGGRAAGGGGEGGGAFSACRDSQDVAPEAKRGGGGEPSREDDTAPMGGGGRGGAGSRCGGPQSVLRVLALHPDAERALLSAAATWDEYASAAAGLADAAAALGRVPAWPSVDCAAAEAWGLESGGGGQEEEGEDGAEEEAGGAGGGLVVGDAALARRRPMSPRRLPPYGGLSPRVIVDHRGRCFPWLMAIPACLNMGRGMLPWELDAWLAHEAPAIARRTMATKAAAMKAAAASGNNASSAWAAEPREGINVIRLRLDPLDETRRADLETIAAAQQRRQLQGVEEEKREDGDGGDTGNGDDDDSSYNDDEDDGGDDDGQGGAGDYSSIGVDASSSSSPYPNSSKTLLDDDDDPSAAPPPPVPGWRVPLLLLDARRLQAAAEALGGAAAPVLYLSSPVALAPGSLSDANDALGGRARLAGAAGACYPLVPGALAELRRNELDARAAEATAKAAEEAARAAQAEAGGDAGAAGAARRRENRLRRESVRLAGRARAEDALHYLLHNMAESTRRTGLLSWAAGGLWRGVPSNGAEEEEVA